MIDIDCRDVKPIMRDLLVYVSDQVGAIPTIKSHGFKIKAIEGGYKPSEKTYLWRKSEYAMIRRGETVIGHLELETSRFGNSKWKIRTEERR